MDTLTHLGAVFAFAKVDVTLLKLTLPSLTSPNGLLMAFLVVLIVLLVGWFASKTPRGKLRDSRKRARAPKISVTVKVDNWFCSIRHEPAVNSKPRQKRIR